MVGKRFHALLHGEDLPSPPRQKRSIGHQHVLAPEQRSVHRAKTVMQELLIKAARRLRQENLFAAASPSISNGLRIRGIGSMIHPH